MSKCNLNKILPVLCLSLCWVYSCSRNSQDLPIESTYSKSEQAAYEAALLAAPNLVDAIQIEKAAIKTYRVVEEKARAAQAEVVQAEEAVNAADKTKDEARSQAKKAALSKKINGTWAMSRYIESDPNYKAAFSAGYTAWSQLQAVREKAHNVARALQAQALKVKAAQGRVDRTKREVHMAAALGAFRHVAEEAIAKTQAELVAQND